MRIERPKEVERFGAVRFGNLQKIFELDSGRRNGGPAPPTSPIQQVCSETLYEIQKNMAVIVPVRSERLKLIEGVLCGIPHACQIIIVSNSPRAPADRFAMEEDALREFCMFVGKKVLIAHQKDPLIAKAFQEAGYKEILGDNDQVRDGKAEGMLIGTLLAWLMGKKYIGFVDSTIDKDAFMKVIAPRPYAQLISGIQSTS